MKAAMRALTMTACFALALPALGQAPFSFDTAPGRLPKNVVPTDYTIDITPNIDALTTRGKESVALQFRSATDTIVFNTLNETLTDVRLDGAPVASVVPAAEQQWTTVKLAKPASLGKHRLTFSFQGKIESQPQGLFLQHYTEPSGAKKVLLSTQFEPADARRMFPCWDEPAFRATYQLTVTAPSGWQTVANMPASKRAVHGKVTATTFERSPKMPSYLVEYSAGDLAAVTATSGSTELAVWAVRGQESYGKVALANAQLILSDYNDYFGYAYPLAKLDSIAIPGGFSGAMENWGAITYNARALLVLPTSTLDDRQTVFSIQAHEMAHQWNGDLVTMGWWDDLWLNESFASWMAAKETDRRHPEWHWWEEEDASKERAMSADARLGSSTIQQHVTNELEATNAFDPAITYSKGQAILRMLEAYVGEDAFRGGVRSYIKARAFSNASPGDLWNALNLTSDKNIGELATGWITHPGFPLISAEASCDSAGQRTLQLRQSRFLLEGEDAKSFHWSVPLRVRVGTSATPTSVLLTQNDQKLAAGRCDEPLSLDADAIGYYRTHYDAATLSLNTKSFIQLPAGDRIALLDDEWALVGAGKEKLASYLALAHSMGNDLNVRAWEQIEHALHTIEFDERGSPGHEAFARYARSIIRPAFDQLGWDSKPGDSAADQTLRRELLEDLGLWGDPAVVAEAHARFEAFLKDHTRLGPEDQAPVLNIVARTADAATFEKLHALAKNAKDAAEQTRYFSALMQVGDESLAAKAAQIAVSDDIPPQADSERLSLIGTLAGLHQNLSWTIFCSHADIFLQPHAPFGPYITAQTLPQIFWSGVPLDQLSSWIRAHVPAQMSGYIDSGLESARFKLKEKQLLVPAADSYSK